MWSRTGFIALIAMGILGPLAAAPQDLESVVTLRTQAKAHMAEGKLAAAESLYIQASQQLDAMQQPDQLLRGINWLDIGELHIAQGRFNDAEQAFRNSIAICGEAHAPNDICTLIAMRHLGELEAAQGKMREAESVVQKAIGILRRTPGQIKLLALSLGTLANVYMLERRDALAEPLLKESLALSSQTGEVDGVLADSMLDMASYYRLQRNSARAAPLLKKALRIYESTNDPHLAGALNEAGSAALIEGNYAVAIQYFRRSLAVLEPMVGPAHLLTGRVQAGLAEAYLGEHNYREARALIQPGLAAERASFGNSHPELARMLMIAAKIEESDLCTAQAEVYYREAMAIFGANFSKRQPERAAAQKQYSHFAKSFHK